MNIIFMTHRILGMLLPVLILGAAIWFTIAWKPNTWPQRPLRLLLGLIGLQIALGVIFGGYLIAVGAGAKFLSLFLLHPLLGILAMGITRKAIRPNGLTMRLGRWGPLALSALLIVVIGGAMGVAHLL
jgi:heme A synthase